MRTPSILSYNEKENISTDRILLAAHTAGWNNYHHLRRYSARRNSRDQDVCGELWCLSCQLRTRRLTWWRGYSFHFRTKKKYLNWFTTNHWNAEFNSPILRFQWRGKSKFWLFVCSFVLALGISQEVVINLVNPWQSHLLSMISKRECLKLINKFMIHLQHASLDV